MIKKIIKIILTLAFCTGVFYMCKECTKDSKHVVIRGKYVNEEQQPIYLDFYRGEKEANEAWFSETGYNMFIWTFDVGYKYKVRFERAGVVKWLYVDAKEGDNYRLVIDFNEIKDIKL